MNKLTVVFTGGGTGGHIYPGLAVADELRILAAEREVPLRLVWLGNSSGMDKEIVEKSGSVDAFYGIPSGKLRRYFSLKNISDVFKIFLGCAVSFFRLLSLRPALVFSKGGFVSVPPCAAAKLLHIPVFTHECDFTPGLATRLNSRFASKILVSYEETRRYFGEKKQKSLVVTGNPVRPVFYSADEARGRAFLFSDRPCDSSKPILLVLGGSLGAHQINQLVTENLDWLCERFTVVHQTGRADAYLTETRHDGYYPYAFIYREMPDVIAAADLVLSRAGANSIWECAVLSKPMVLIPLCGSGTRGDQVDNAQFFADKGAACVLTGEEANSDRLKQTLSCAIEPEFRARMADAVRALADGKPAAKIAALIMDTLQQ
ncbi:MAG: undecaprenyldiphospho-muramoylpentapeptide beta-N-acetylglucosaminyltransferase [Treponema sp.]|nr:undecaprenyldiphospho-muramoylpentapeptide beta-N-acetylglucosaminyltransferase [Treponema sp.]